MSVLTALSPTNFHKPCLCVLALDVSSSMAGTPITGLNLGLQDFYQSIYRDDEAAEKLEISIVTFGSEVRCIQEPAKVDDFKMPILNANGTTKLVEGIRLAIKQVELRKEYYKKHSPQYFRPMIIVFTDGEPDVDQDINGLYKQILLETNSKKYTIHVIGTPGCNFVKAAQFCPIQMIHKLDGLRYSDFFKWLSRSTDELSIGKNIIDISGSDFIEQTPII